MISLSELTNAPAFKNLDPGTQKKVIKNYYIKILKQKPPGNLSPTTTIHTNIPAAAASSAPASDKKPEWQKALEIGEKITKPTKVKTISLPKDKRILDNIILVQEQLNPSLKKSKKDKQIWQDQLKLKTFLNKHPEQQKTYKKDLNKFKLNKTHEKLMKSAPAVTARAIAKALSGLTGGISDIVLNKELSKWEKPYLKPRVKGEKTIQAAAELLGAFLPGSLWQGAARGVGKLLDKPIGITSKYIYNNLKKYAGEKIASLVTPSLSNIIHSTLQGAGTMGGIQALKSTTQKAIDKNYSLEKILKDIYGATKVGAIFGAVAGAGLETARITLPKFTQKRQMSNAIKEARKILGADKNATLDDLKKIYKQKAKHLRPDLGLNKEEFIKVSRAYKLLTETRKSKILKNLSNYLNKWGTKGIKSKTAIVKYKGKPFKMPAPEKIIKTTEKIQSISKKTPITKSDYIKKELKRKLTGPDKIPGEKQQQLLKNKLFKSEQKSIVEAKKLNKIKSLQKQLKNLQEHTTFNIYTEMNKIAGRELNYNNINDLQFANANVNKIIRADKLNKDLLKNNISIKDIEKKIGKSLNPLNTKDYNILKNEYENILKAKKAQAEKINVNQEKVKQENLDKIKEIAGTKTRTVEERPFESNESLIKKVKNLGGINSNNLKNLGDWKNIPKGLKLQILKKNGMGVDEIAQELKLSVPEDMNPDDYLLQEMIKEWDNRNNENVIIHQLPENRDITRLDTKEIDKQINSLETQLSKNITDVKKNEIQNKIQQLQKQKQDIIDKFKTDNEENLQALKDINEKIKMAQDTVDNAIIYDIPDSELPKLKENLNNLLQEKYKIMKSFKNLSPEAEKKIKEIEKIFKKKQKKIVYNNKGKENVPAVIDSSKKAGIQTQTQKITPPPIEPTVEIDLNELISDPNIHIPNKTSLGKILNSIKELPKTPKNANEINKLKEKAIEIIHQKTQGYNTKLGTKDFYDLIGADKYPQAVLDMNNIGYIDTLNSGLADEVTDTFGKSIKENLKNSGAPRTSTYVTKRSDELFILYDNPEIIQQAVSDSIKKLENKTFKAVSPKYRIKDFADKMLKRGNVPTWDYTIKGMQTGVEVAKTGDLKTDVENLKKLLDLKDKEYYIIIKGISATGGYGKDAAAATELLEKAKSNPELKKSGKLIIGGDDYGRVNRNTSHETPTETISQLQSPVRSKIGANSVNGRGGQGNRQKIRRNNRPSGFDKFRNQTQTAQRNSFLKDEVAKIQKELYNNNPADVKQAIKEYEEILQKQHPRLYEEIKDLPEDYKTVFLENTYRDNITGFYNEDYLKYSNKSVLGGLNTPVFKKVNDGLGYEYGDRVKDNVARTIKEVGARIGLTPAELNKAVVNYRAAKHIILDVPNVARGKLQQLIEQINDEKVSFWAPESVIQSKLNDPELKKNYTDMIDTFKKNGVVEDVDDFGMHNFDNLPIVSTPGDELGRIISDLRQKGKTIGEEPQGAPTPIQKRINRIAETQEKPLPVTYTINNKPIKVTPDTAPKIIERISSIDPDKLTPIDKSVLQAAEKMLPEKYKKLDPDTLLNGPKSKLATESFYEHMQEKKTIEENYNNAYEKQISPDPNIEKIKKYMNSTREIREAGANVNTIIQNLYKKAKDVLKSVKQTASSLETSGNLTPPNKEIMLNWVGNKQWTDAVATSLSQKLRDAVKIIVKKYKINNSDTVLSIFKKPIYVHRVGNKTRWYTKYDIIDMAMRQYIDLKNDPMAIENYLNSANVSKFTKFIVELSQMLPDELKQLADKYEAITRKFGKMAQDAGIISNLRDHYVYRAYQGKRPYYSGFATSSGHAKQREYLTELQAEASGNKPIPFRLSDSVGNTIKDTIKVLYDTDLKNRLENTIYDIDEETGVKQYVFDTHKYPGYKKIEHPAFNKWEYYKKLPVEDKIKFEKEKKAEYLKGYIVKNDGTVLKAKPLYAPKDVATYLNNILMPGKLKDTPVLKPIAKLNQKIKNIILKSSLFHPVQLSLQYWIAAPNTLNNTLKIWNRIPYVAYKKAYKEILNLSPAIEYLVKKGGLTLGGVRDIEVPKNTTDSRYTYFVFQKYAPALKAAYATSLFEKALKKFNAGKINKEQLDLLAKIYSEQANEIFGGLNLERAGVNKDVWELSKLIIFSPDWTLSNTIAFLKLLPIRKEAKGYLITRIKNEESLTEALEKIPAEKARKWHLNVNETKYYWKMWLRIKLNLLLNVIFLNLLIHGGNTRKKYIEKVKKNPIHIFDIDIGPLIPKRFRDPNNQYWFRIGSTFTDPLRWATQPIRTAYGKSSWIARTWISLLTKQNWNNQPYLSVSKWKKRKSYLGYPGEKSEKGWGTMPAWMLDRLITSTPIQMQSLLEYLQGQSDAFFTLSRIFGMPIHRGYIKKKRHPKVTYNFNKNPFTSRLNKNPFAKKSWQAQLRF